MSLDLPKDYLNISQAAECLDITYHDFLKLMRNGKSWVIQEMNLMGKRGVRKLDLENYLERGGTEKLESIKNPPKKITELYRHYDSEDNLLYIGISKCTSSRLKGHKFSSNWYYDIVKITIERFDTRDAALKAEREAIESEHPIHNIEYNDK